MNGRAVAVFKAMLFNMLVERVIGVFGMVALTATVRIMNAVLIGAHETP